MTDKNIAIKIDKLTKIYKLYDKPIDRMKEALHWRGKRYHKDFYALHDISFEIKKGETLGIIGRNGSGKSTLLKIITGVLTQSSGNVTVNGRISALLELGAGFNPDYTGIENIYFQGNLMGLTEDIIEDQIPRILEFADIGDFIHQPVKSYSSGMFARLAFAVAINVEPDILIVDEALSVGDAYFQQKCMRVMRKFCDNGGMMLFVSHDTGAVNGLCQKVLWLNNGQNLYFGETKEGTERYLKDYYLSSLEPDKVISDVHQNKALQTKSEIESMQINIQQDIIDHSTLRNDLKIFRFKHEDTNFGLKGAEVVEVGFYDENGKKILYMLGGHKVCLRIHAVAHIDLYSVILGFQIKDRLGQFLFGDNNYLMYQDSPFEVKANEDFYAEYKFYIPMLPKGYYSVCIGLAEGTQETHVQHHFLHEALAFESINESPVFGLLGIPMLDIKLFKKF